MKLLWIVFFGMLSSLSAGVVLVDSLIGEGSSSTTFGGERYLAQKFQTGGEEVTIDLVELKLSLEGISGMPQVELWSNDSFDFPKSSLLSLTGSQSVDATRIYAFTPTESLILFPNTDYWILVKGSVGESDTAQFRWWYLSQNEVGTGEGFSSSNGLTNTGGSQWSLFSGWPMMMRLRVSSVSDFDVTGWTWNGWFPWVYSPEHGWLYYLPTDDGLWIKKKQTAEWTLKR